MDAAEASHQPQNIRQHDALVPVLSVSQWLNHQIGPGHRSTCSTNPDGKKPLPLLIVSQEPADSSESWIPVYPTHTLVHIPPNELAQRSFELPPRNVGFVVLVDVSLKSDVLEYLLHSFDGQSTLRNDQPSPPSWSVRGVILDGPLTRQELRTSLTDNSLTIRSNPTFLSVHRLWEPDPLVERHLLPFLRSRLTQQRLSLNAPYTAGPSEVWDLGAGVGRDVAFLARALLEGLATNSDRNQQQSNVRIVGIDQRYKSDKQCQRCQEFWKRQGVGHVTDCRYLDLKRRDGALEEVLRRSKPWCLYAVRFCHAPLLDCISRVSPPGTVFALSHFCKPSRGAGWNFPHPKEKHVLERDELRSVFRSDWKIVVDDIIRDSDYGRTLIQFLAFRTEGQGETGLDSETLV